jgi:hypothetical protein
MIFNILLFLLLGLSITSEIILRVITTKHVA